MTTLNENGSAAQPSQFDPPGGGAAADEPSQRGKMLAIALAAASVLLAGWVLVRYITTDRGEGLDNAMTYWRCLNETCGAGFQMTRAELYRTVEAGPPSGEPPQLTVAELNAQSVCGLEGTPLWCPECGSYLIGKAYPCPHCGGLVPVLKAHGRLPDVCEHCGRNPSLPAGEEDAPASDEAGTAPTGS